MKNLITFLWVGALLLLPQNIYCRSIDITSEGKFTRVVLELGEDINFQVKPDPGLDYIDVGIQNLPPAYIPSVEGKSSSVVDKMTIQAKDTTTSDLRIFLKKSTDKTQLDFVDFRLLNPVRLVIDIWDKTKVEVEEPKPIHVVPVIKKSLPKKLKSAKIIIEKKAPLPERGPARVLDGKNPQDDLYKSELDEDLLKMIKDPSDPRLTRYRFDKRVVNIINELASKDDIYVHYPTLYKDIVLTIPDIKYPESNNRNKEELQYNVLLKFIEQNKIGLAFKTMELFNEEFPASKFRENIMFIHGDLLLKVANDLDSKYYLEEAVSAYKAALAKFPASKFGARAFMLLGRIYMKKGFHYGALEVFETALRRYPESEFTWQMRMGRADMLLKSGHYSRSFKEFRKLYEDAVLLYNKDKERKDVLWIAAEALYRLGDIFFEQRTYKEAISRYSDALRIFPEEEFKKAFPNSLFNLGECYFWLNMYEESLNSFIGFVINFPNHKFSGLAMNRIGENLNLLGASYKQVKSAYLETIFRYPESLGASYARIRLASDEVILAKKKDLKQYISVLDAGMKDTVNPDLAAFSVILKGEALIKRGIYLLDDSIMAMGIEVWRDFIRKHPLTLYYSKIKDKVNYGVAEMLEVLSTKQLFYNVVKTYEAEVGVSISENDPIGLLLTVADAYDELSLPEKLKEKLGRYENLKGNREMRLYKVLKASELIDEGNNKMALALLQEVARKGLDPDPNYKFYGSFKKRHVYLYDVVYARLAESMGDFKTQVRYILEAISIYSGEDKNRILHHKLQLATAYKKLNNLDEALKIYMELYTHYKEAGDDVFKNSEIAKEATYYIGHLCYNQNKFADAVKYYKEALSVFPDYKEVGLAHFRIGKSLLLMGQKEDAKTVFATILLNKQYENTWKKLAQEELDSMSWKEPRTSTK